MILQVLIFIALKNVHDTSQICMGINGNVGNLKHFGINNYSIYGQSSQEQFLWLTEKEKNKVFYLEVLHFGQLVKFRLFFLGKIAEISDFFATKLWHFIFSVYYSLQ